MSEQRSTGFANGMARVLALVSSTVLLGFLWYASRRGFDITDESFYFLTTTRPDDVRVYPGFGHLYGSVFSRFGVEAVSAVRLLCVAGLAIAGATFGWMLGASFSKARNLPDSPIDPLIAACVGLQGALSYYTWTLMGPGYNYFVCLFSLGLVASLLAGLQTGNVRSRPLYLAVAGACVAATLFVKITAGAGLLFMSLALLAIWPHAGPGRRGSLIALLGGLLGWAGFHFLTLMSPAESWARWTAGLEGAIAGDIGYGSQTLVLYRRDIVDVTAFLFQHYGVAVVFALLARLVPARYQGMRIAFYGIAIAWMIYQGIVGRVWSAGSESCINCRVVLHYACWIVIALIATFPWPMRMGLVRDTSWLISAALLGTPVLASIGTSNRPGMVIGMTLAPWLFFLFLTAARIPSKRSWASAVAGTMVCLLTTSQVVSAFVVAPYRLATGIQEQTHPVEFGRGKTLLVDHETARFWERLQAAARHCGLTPGTDILGFYNVPGVVFALDGRSPGVPWFFGGWPGSTEYAEFVLARIERSRLARAWVLEGQPLVSPLPDLRRFGVDFPRSFELCGSAVWPFDQRTILLWKPGKPA